MTDWTLPQLLGIDRAAVAAGPSSGSPSGPVVTGRAGLPLDGAAAIPIRPERQPGPRLPAARPGLAVWVPDAGRWRHGAILTQPRTVKGAGGPNEGTVRAVVEWVVDRTGRLAEASYPISELRDREAS